MAGGVVLVNHLQILNSILAMIIMIAVLVLLRRVVSAVHLVVNIATGP